VRREPIKRQFEGARHQSQQMIGEPFDLSLVSQHHFAKARQVKWWERFEQCQRIAESLLVIGLPILNLCLLGLGVAMLPKHLDKLPRPSGFGPEYAYSLALDSLVRLLALIITGATLYAKREQWFRKVGWPLSVLA